VTEKHNIKALTSLIITIFLGPKLPLQLAKEHLEHRLQSLMTLMRMLVHTLIPLQEACVVSWSYLMMRRIHPRLAKKKGRKFNNVPLSMSTMRIANLPISHREPPNTFLNNLMVTKIPILNLILMVISENMSPGQKRGLVCTLIHPMI
jgi:hypothetical protein